MPPAIATTAVDASAGRSGAGAELDDGRRRLVGLLALVAGQDVEPGDQPGSWRIGREVTHERVISTLDP
jgi:hypothetical protein